MKHTVVAWDASFRACFHLLRSLAGTDYDLDQVEIVFVEQRTKDTADRVAAAHGVQPVHEIAEEIGRRVAVQVIYLDEPDTVAYHPGRLLNAGIVRARGTIVSTMDADVLVPPGFFEALDAVHADGPRVATMFRHQAPAPCGVPVESWTRQIVDYQRVLRMCGTRDQSIPDRVGNKAPLLSAHRDHWEAIGGYDPHRLFSTAYTLFGRDVARRFKLLLGDVERTLPVAGVHPWHPTEMRRRSDPFRILTDVQTRAIAWSVERRLFDVRARREASASLYAAHADALDRAIARAEEEMRRSTRPVA